MRTSVKGKRNDGDPEVSVLGATGVATDGGHERRRAGEHTHTHTHAGGR